MINDIVADGLTRIRNASQRRINKTSVVYSGLMKSVLDVFKRYGYIKNYNVIQRNKKNSINVILKYKKDGSPTIRQVSRISKPSRRVYKGSKDIKLFKSGYGISVVSTSKGVLSNIQTYKQNIGGEVICSIW